MNRIIINEPLKHHLDDAGQPVELVDESGKRFGYFVPLIIAETDDGCPYSPEELSQMQSEPGGRTLKEIWTALVRNEVWSDMEASGRTGARTNLDERHRSPSDHGCRRFH
ncbi:MAG: hypothetical protein WEB58_12940 [Planctomycetaceae bacterium]